jgi:hypothetical protein
VRSKARVSSSEFPSACFTIGAFAAKAGEEPFARFFSAVTRVREAHRARLIERVVAAAKADWKAASWLLERQFASEFSRSEPRMIVIDRPPPPGATSAQPSGTTYYWTTKGNEIPFTREQLDYIAKLRSQYPPASPSKKNGDRQL